MAPADLPADKSLWPRRLPNESMRAYGAFRIYREMGPARSQLRTAAEYYDLDLETVTDKVLAVKCRQIAEWSRNFAWVKRIEEHDNQIDDLAAIEAAAALGRMRDKHATVGQVLISKGLAAIKDLNPADISPAMARMFIQTGALVERQARPGDVLRIEHAGSVGTVNVADQLREMLAVTAEMGTAAVWGDDAEAE